jgi:phage shock protein PspC (stress-responsive transcriptional regulator)
MIEAPRPRPATDQWFYVRDGKRFGPTDVEGLQVMADSLHLRRDCQLFKDRESSPLLAASLEGLTFPPTPALEYVADSRYVQLYRSSDDRWLLGLCGGLAHRWGVPTILVRLGMALFACVGWAYPLCIKLPALPTKGVPRK